jgi:hypothetical protein
MWREFSNLWTDPCSRPKLANCFPKQELLSCLRFLLVFTIQSHLFLKLSSVYESHRFPSSATFSCGLFGKIVELSEDSDLQRPILAQPCATGQVQMQTRSAVPQDTANPIS